MTLAASPGSLSNPLQFLKGVGPKRALLFGELGLSTVEDLLRYFPRDWQNRQETKDLSLPTATGLVVLKAKVVKAGHFQAGPRLALFKAKLNTGEGTVEAVWFKHLSRRYDVFASLKKEIVPGADLWVVGRAQASLLGIRELHVDEHYLLSDQRWRLHVGRIVPVYALTEGITQRFLRELVHRTLSESVAETPETLPRDLIEKRELLALPQALKGIHFPGSQAELEASRSRLAYEELLLLELAWILKRRQTQSIEKGFAYEIKRELLTPFKSRLGFELTGAQKRVINEIFSDMQRSYPMTRLLQGDVGSGKTVVALSALLLAVENGYQGAFMAPTEILADQHMATMTRFLKGLPVRTAMLTSRVPKKDREKVLTAVRKGEVDLLVGTPRPLGRRRPIPEPQIGGHRRAAPLRRAPALDLAPEKLALGPLGHDGHADPEDLGDGFVRRSGCLDLGRDAARQDHGRDLVLERVSGLGGRQSRGRPGPPGLHRLPDHRGIKPFGPPIGQGRVQALERDRALRIARSTHPRRDAGQDQDHSHGGFRGRQI
ncbi:MAG: DEAD/DEAH box helicase [Elusimicrobia bacterium]|nr:DEAD/DEAH box helicase [Elusimicrobiota bacterium]